jgi:NADPH:quinone reductase-like Zn-dependent oxidoreductase
MTAYTGVPAEPGDTVAISGAAGGVGSVASPLARRAGTQVLANAGPADAVWLHSIGAYADRL